MPSNNAPNDYFLGSASVASLFALVGGGVLWVVVGFDFLPSIALAAGIFAVVCGALLLMWSWQPPADLNKKAPVAGSAPTAGSREFAPPAPGPRPISNAGTAPTPAGTSLTSPFTNTAIASPAAYGARVASPDASVSATVDMSASAEPAVAPRISDSATVEVSSEAEHAEEAALEAKVASSTPLAGEKELSERKGEWSYEGKPEGVAGADTQGGKPAAAADPAPAEGALGTRPRALDGPREGGADDLTKIDGIGPKLSGLLNEHGIYHFDQIAQWGAAEVEWMDNNLLRFKGRVSRDDWVAQAKALAKG